MVRRSSLASLTAFAAGLALALAPPALAQESQGFTFGHDDALDGTPDEIVSGFFGGEDGLSDPLSEGNRVPNSFETFEIVVPEGERNGSMTVRIEWQDAEVDLDLYLYRYRADGTLVESNIAASAAFGSPFEELTYTPRISGDPVEAGRYLIVVDNWCTNKDDPLSQDPTSGCTLDVPDEDDFIGRVTFGASLPTNALPSVTLSGPDSGAPGQTLSFTAEAADTDGEVRNYAFDLDGDGRFEYDNATSGTVTKAFDAPGTYNVGVRVIDDRGGQSFASRPVSIAAPAAAGAGGGGGPAALPRVLLRNFTLGRPVFGGERRRGLAIRYRLNEDARVDVSLYRGSRRIKRLARGDQVAGKTYRLTAAAKGLKRGRYTVLLNVRTADGRVQQARLASRLL